MATFEEAVALLRGQGMRMTPQRVAIVREIVGSEGFLVPGEMIERIQRRVPGVSPSTVYRTLERLQEAGMLTHVHLHSGVGYHRLEEVQHAHLTCRQCGAEAELSTAALRRLERAVVQESGFRPDFTHHAIVGLCAACQARAAGVS